MVIQTHEKISTNELQNQDEKIFTAYYLNVKCTKNGKSEYLIKNRHYKYDSFETCCIKAEHHINSKQKKFDNLKGHVEIYLVCAENNKKFTYKKGIENNNGKWIYSGFVEKITKKDSIKKITFWTVLMFMIIFLEQVCNATWNSTVEPYNQIFLIVLPLFCTIILFPLHEHILRLSNSNIYTFGLMFIADIPTILFLIISIKTLINNDIFSQADTYNFGGTAMIILIYAAKLGYDYLFNKHDKHLEYENDV